MPATVQDHFRVSLSRFKSNTGELLDLASKQPVVLTVHSRERHVLADSGYFRHLERAALVAIAGHMNVEALASSDMTEADRRAFANSRPSDGELANDCWED